MTETGTRTVWGRSGGGAASADRGLLVLALGAVLCGIPASTSHAAAPGSQDNPSVLPLVREAAIAARTNLRTGHTKGSFRMWGPDKKLIQNARFSGAFDGSKHYLKLAYEPTSNPAVRIEHDKRIVVCDGSELFVSRFSERIRPVGAEADVYKKGSQYMHHATQGFPASLKVLAAGILTSETLDKYAVEMERLPNGHYRGKYEVSPTYHTMFEVAPEYGYHCTLAESSRGTELVHRWIVAWESVDDLWYAKSGKAESYSEGKHSETYEWQLDEFEPNVPVSPELFTLNALELPGGVRIFDHRRPEGPVVTDFGKPTPHKPKIYRLPDTEGKIEQKQADRLVEQVQAMPQLYQTEQVSSAWGLRIWGLAIGLLGIVAIAIVWLIQKRNTA